MFQTHSSAGSKCQTNIRAQRGLRAQPAVDTEYVKSEQKLEQQTFELFCFQHNSTSKLFKHPSYIQGLIIVSAKYQLYFPRQGIVGSVQESKLYRMAL